MNTDEMTSLMCEFDGQRIDKKSCIEYTVKPFMANYSLVAIFD